MTQFLPHQQLHALEDAQENFDAIDGHVLQTALNLSDVASAASARTNLGLGTSATHATGDFAQTANNLSDLANAATARANIGAGTGTGWGTIVKTTSDQTTTNTTQTDVPQLVVALLAGTTYEFEAVLRTSSSTVAGTKYGMDYALVDMSAYALFSGSTSGTAAAVCSMFTSIGLTTTTYNTVVQDGMVIAKGEIVTTNAGNFQMCQAKVTSGTATVRAGSVLKVRVV